MLAVRSYVNLLWSHILREDHLLFVAADDLLPVTEQQALSACARIEGTLMNAAARTHYDALLITMESAAAAWVLPGIGQSQLEPDVPRWRRAVLSVRGRSTDAQGVDRLVSA